MSRRNPHTVITTEESVVWELDKFKSNIHARHHHALIKVIILAGRYKRKHPESYEQDNKEIDDLIIKRYLTSADSIYKKPKKEKWKPMNPYDKSKKDILKDELDEKM